ncbi:PA14 domain-containing protein [Chitinophaga arvensicola]|uniref:Uncharacterized protein n=1 Tax=Chitinophaga arvensicola TaxID=29529 RepID=A0A1I0S8Q1_9BACT|nr:hypothetical protein [Chitinophaga arvensicola]SEW52527.1 hypothetical protein SAMN04488122_4905 [Chitinophaga arvensicola]
MNKLYTGALLGLAIAASSCGSKKIKIESINNRQQLDSVIALLPKTQVKVDSIPVRVLYMHLKGDFTFYGQPVKEFSIQTKDEQLQACTFDIEKGASDVLQQLENENGTGFKEYSNPILSWSTLPKKIQFSVQDFDGDLLTLSNKEKAAISLYFNNPVNNRITNIYKEIPPVTTTNDYQLEVDNSECGYRLYVNDFLVIDHAGARTLGVTADINPYLVKGKQQKVTVELLPGNDYDGNPRNRLHLESVVHVALKKSSKRSMFSSVVFDFRTPNADSMVREDAHSSRYIRASKFYGQLSAKVDHPFETDAVPYELPCYAAAVTDIRTIPDAKEKILAHYRKLQQAYLEKDSLQLEKLLYPLEKNLQTAWYWSKPIDGQTRWTNIMDKAREARDVKLEENVVLYTTPDGHFAKLLPAVYNKNPAFYLSKEDGFYPLDYYVNIDKNGDVQFAID